jgi:esterase/lipase superfamily enzyme
MMSFDWPSRASLLDYQADKANAAYATRQFRELLTFLATETKTDRINIIAHSAGSPIVIESLRDLSLMHRELDADALREHTRIGRVVLAAPDMDLLVAINAGLDGAARVPEALAIYASTQDKALGFSGKIFDADRLGASVHRLTDKERQVLRQSATQAIDVTNAERRSGSLLGHSYYHQNPWVSSDVALLVAVGATPAERGLVRDDKTAFWSFPDDYQSRIKEIAKQLLAKYSRDNPVDRGQ